MLGGRLTFLLPNTLKATRGVTYEAGA